MNVPIRKPWTQEQFFAWAEAQEEPYEFDGFKPVAMTGGNAGHSRITGNVHFALRVRLRSGPCEPLGPDAGVETLPGCAGHVHQVRESGSCHPRSCRRV